MIDGDPATVKAFVAATIKGWQYALDNQAEALTLTAKYENKDDKDAEREKHILRESAPLIKTTGRNIGSMDYLVWNETVARMKADGLVSKQFDTNKVYTTKFTP